MGHPVRLEFIRVGLLCGNKWAFARLNIITYKIFIYKLYIGFGFKYPVKVDRLLNQTKLGASGVVIIMILN